jgi:hypothetical protein
MFQFSCRSIGEALLGVKSRVESSIELRKLSQRSVNSCILTFLYRLSPSSYVFRSCFVLSLDACITITRSLLFVVIALWVICLTQ